MRRKELGRERIFGAEPVVEIGIELFFVIGRQRRTRDSAAWSLRRWNQEMSIRKLQVQEFQGNRIYRAYAKRVAEGYRGAIIWIGIVRLSRGSAMRC